MKKLAVMFALVFLTACGHPSQGRVASKSYDEAYSYPRIYCAAYNAKGICTLWMTQQVYVPECWKLNLRAEDDKWSVCVSKDEWDHTQPDTTWKEK